jgi:hypothetical protein
MVSVAPVTKFVPVTVTLVPPRLPPVAGEMFEIVGAGRGVYVNAFAAMPVCVSGFATAIATAPVAAPAGVVAVMLVALATETPVAVTPPMVTVAPATKPVPVIVMLVPPPTLPEVGAALVTVGAAAAVYVNALASVADCPSLFATTIEAAPIGLGGVVAVMLVALATTTFVAALPPTVTVAPARNCVPVIVMLVPPAEVPVAGATSEVVGAGYW